MKEENGDIKSVMMNDDYEKYITVGSFRGVDRDYTSPVLLVYIGFRVGTCWADNSGCGSTIINSGDGCLALEKFLDIDGNNSIKNSASDTVDDISIDLGCGSHKRDGFIGLDINDLDDVDIVINIDKKPLPFPDDSIISLVADNFMEHVLHLDFVMDEIGRICKNGANVEIVVPHFKSIPCEEHVREFRSSSLNNYEIGNINKGYMKFLICKNRELMFKSRWLNLLFSSHPYFFERFYPFRVNCQLKMLFEVKK